MSNLRKVVAIGAAIGFDLLDAGIVMANEASNGFGLVIAGLGVAVVLTAVFIGIGWSEW